MQDTLFAVTSNQSVGCTFVDWSMHFLSGQDRFYSMHEGWIPLSDQPLTGQNAHGHKRNHPEGQEETAKAIDLLRTQSGVRSFYPTSLTIPIAAKKLAIDLSSQLDQHRTKQIVEFCSKDFNTLLHNITDQKIKLIYINLDPDCLPYLAGKPRSNQHTVKKYGSTGQSFSHEEIENDFQDLFFADSKETWRSKNLTEIWDERERLALCTDPFDQKGLDINFDFEHRWVSARYLWSDTEHVISSLLDYVGLPIDKSRQDRWRTICQQWIKIQRDRIRFSIEYLHIVECIINGWYMEIDLDFYQEVIIQHCLIYYHGLNLKTWNLRKFPSNTKDLHALLEPNIHSQDRPIPPMDSATNG